MEDDSQATALFEVISSHFADVFINHVYGAARQEAESGRARSVTEAYQRCVKSYITGVRSNREDYRKTAGILHTYVQRFSRYRMTDYSGFVDRVVQYLVPEEYFAELNSRERDEIFGTALCDLVAALGVFFTREDVLPRVVDREARRDSRVANVTATMAQDHGAVVLSTLRNDLFNKFLGVSSGARSSPSDELVTKLKKAIRTLAREKAELTAEVEELREATEALAQKARRYKRDLAETREALSRVVSSAASGGGGHHRRLFSGPEGSGEEEEETAEEEESGEEDGSGSEDEDEGARVDEPATKKVPLASAIVQGAPAGGREDKKRRPEQPAKHSVGFDDWGTDGPSIDPLE